MSLSQGSFCDLCNMCHRNQHVSLKLTCPIKRTCLNQSHMCHRSQHVSGNSICIITDNLSCKCVNNQQLCYPRMLVSRIQNVSQKPTCLTGVTQANMCQPSQHVSRGHSVSERQTCVDDVNMCHTCGDGSRKPSFARRGPL